MNYQWYQWTSGPDAGDIETFSHESNGMLYFKSGNTVSKSSVGMNIIGINNIDDLVLETSKTKSIENINEKDMNEQNLVQFKGLVYPTKEELAKYSNGDGQYSLGQSAPIPRPDDEMIYHQGGMVAANHIQTLDPMLAGIEDEFSVSTKVSDDTYDFLGGIEEESFTPKQPVQTEKMTQPAQIEKKADALQIMIDNAKKENVELSLTFKAKIPVAAFFAAMDDNFVKKNQKQLLSDIISGIKSNEFEKQMIVKLKDFYGIK